MKSLQDVYRDMMQICITRQDNFGYGYWAKRLREAQAIARGGALC